MTFFKLTALALASTLALTGCGSDSGGSGGNSTSTPNPSTPVIPPKPPVDNTLSELEQAKGIVNTAKQFILDNKAIKDAYEGASDILTEQQEQRINATFDVPADLSTYMSENNIAKLTSADIIALNAKNDANFKKALGNITLTPSSDFVAMQNANGEFTLSGTASITSQKNDYVYNDTTNTGDWVVTKDTFTTIFDGFKQKLNANTSSTTFKGAFGFNSINIGSGNKAVVLSSSSQGATVNAQFSDKVVVNEEFDINEANAAGITLQKAVIKLGDVMLKANDSVINARDLELGFLDMSYKRADGSLLVRTLPSTIKLTGQWRKQQPATDVTLSLNAVANEDDIKNVIKVTQDGRIEEAANKFVGVEIVASLKGQVARKNNSTTSSIPIDIQANVKRMTRKDIELQGLNAMVDGKKLYVTGKTILDTQYHVTCKCTQLNISQNNASVNLKFDVNNDFIIQNTSTGKFADIKVKGKVFGELLKNNGSINAKFTDNSFITLG